MKLISVAEMISIEKKANEAGLSIAEMMRNAGSGLARIVLDRFAKPGIPLNILGLIGSGNNGNDTLIALTELQKSGWQTYAIIYKNSGNLPELVKTFEETGGTYISPEKVREMPQLDIVLDGLLGTGGKPPLKPDLAKLIQQVSNDLKLHPVRPIVIAVDCPSGIDCETGEIPEKVLRADLTICMAAVKDGLLKHPALTECNEFSVVDIGLEKVLPAWSKNLGDVISYELIESWMPERNADGHKGTYGKTLIVGGSANYVGAPALAAKAACRSGAGLVTIASPQRVQQSMAAFIPEVTWELLSEYDGMIEPGSSDTIRKILPDFSSIVLGPGIGNGQQISKFVESLIFQNASQKQTSMGFGSASPIPPKKDVSVSPLMVVDADGLRALSTIKDWEKHFSSGNVLTPHPGEMALLTGKSVEEIQSNRIQYCRDYSSKWKQVVVLKGAATVVAEPGGQYSILPVMTTALAHAGTGDVLAGIIAGLMAQKVTPYHAACIGVYLHGTAAKLAKKRLGSSASVLPLDLIEGIGAVIDSIIKYE